MTFQAVTSTLRKIKPSKGTESGWAAGSGVGGVLLCMGWTREVTVRWRHPNKDLRVYRKPATGCAGNRHPVLSTGTARRVRRVEKSRESSCLEGKLMCSLESIRSST